MNLADSMKYVLRNKGHIFTNHWKEDITFVLKEVADDASRLIKAPGKKVKLTFQEVKDAASDGLVILKVLPGRITQGFTYFKEDFLAELESHTDQKNKTIFSLKVIGALTSFTLGTVYNVRKGRVDFNIHGLKTVNAFTRLIVAEIIFKISRLMILRFLEEVEKEMGENEEASSIRYFKDLLSSKNDDEDHSVPYDPAIEIVENLKKYIMTGKRRIE